MFAKLFLVSVLLVGVSSRYLIAEVPDYYIEQYEEQPEHWGSSRVRRQAAGSVTVNSDGTSDAAVKKFLTGNEHHQLSAIGSVDLTNKLKVGASTVGLAYDNDKGHGATLTNTHIPGFGDRLTGTGKVNLFHNDNHDLSAKAFATRNMPTIPQLPNYNSVGGGLDYMYKDKIGASASARHTDLFDRNDYSVGGKLNIFKSPTTSLDFNAGFSKFDTPSFKSSWEPSTGFSFTKTFKNFDFF